MKLKKGQSEMSKIIWWVVLLIFLLVAGYLYFTLKGEGAGLLDKFFNLF
ncbi:MAG: hypothetical protein Q8R47_01160 [Nanoarchaeota archaeon]|nr:hypothetical protein [Nanoarchaeota archaeon]